MNNVSNPADKSSITRTTTEPSRMRADSTSLCTFKRAVKKKKKKKSVVN